MPGDFNGDGKTDLLMVQNEGSSHNAYSVALGGGIPATVPITVQTDPEGLQFSVDGAPPQTAPQTINLTPGTHNVATTSPQTGSPGTQYVLMDWSDGGSASHSITFFASATYFASFKAQYQLTTAVNVPSAGTVTPASGTYYDPGSIVSLTATPNSPYSFTSWSGAATGFTNPTAIAMSAPESVTANFSLPASICASMGDSITDVQRVINEALGLRPPADDLNLDGVVDIADVESLIATALGLGCLY